MSRQVRVARLVALALLVVLGLAPQAAAQEGEKKKKKKELPNGAAVLWREPTDIASRDLLLGPGGAGMRPNLSRLEFIREEKGGWSKKYRVKDADGRVWVAKLGKEAQSETAAVRLVWAVGYPTEVNYLVPSVEIPGKGTFTNVRFEARPEGVERLDEWTWEGNPFAGKRELQGLIVLMAFLNNWDLKDENNVIMHTPGRGRDELLYVISDLGATLGKTGSGRLWQLKRSRNHPQDYSEAKFVERVEDGYVKFNFAGVNKQLLDRVTAADARWIGSWLARLSDRQLRDAFRAANYTDTEISLFTGAVKARIRELTTLPAGRDAARR